MTSINVVHGGFVRWTGDVDSSSGSFTPGYVLELMSNGNVRAFTGSSTSSVKGLALETKYSSSATSADSKNGVPSSTYGKVSMLLDEAVVEVDAITSGITFKPNDSVYVASGGLLTTATSVNHVLGKALTITPWTQTLTWFHSVQY